MAEYATRADREKREGRAMAAGDPAAAERRSTPEAPCSPATRKTLVFELEIHYMFDIGQNIFID